MGHLTKRCAEPIEQNQALVARPFPLLDARSELYKAFLELDRRVRAIANKDEVCQLLRTIPVSVILPR